jgi:hypothetical protein
MKIVSAVKRACKSLWHNLPMLTIGGVAGCVVGIAIGMVIAYHTITHEGVMEILAKMWSESL